ncbi:MAG: hypothetical protein HC876_02780 [Chloroflexaceae bacterium]|nr:hypothetical protein [Chloroflexaceae bacterium]
MKSVALVVFAIADTPHRATHTHRHLSVTRPYLEHLAERLGGDLLIFTDRQREGRQLPAWQKLCIPASLSHDYEMIVCMDFDILPHPLTPLDDLLHIPAGKVAMCAVASDARKAQHSYRTALGLDAAAVSNVRHVLNSGVFAWKTASDGPIRALFDQLFTTAQEHCSEQSAFAHAIQQRGMHHLLHERYNTQYVRAKPFPFGWHRPNKVLLNTPALRSIARLTDMLALRALFAKPCFIHFVGGMYADALTYGAAMLGDPWQYQTIATDGPSAVFQKQVESL